MKLKLSEVLDADIGLSEIAKAKMPVHVGFKLARAIKAVHAEAMMGGESLNKLLTEHGAPREKEPSVFDIALDRRVDYMAAVKALHDAEIDVVVEPVELPGTLEVPPAALLAAGPLVVLQAV